MDWKAWLFFFFRYENIRLGTETTVLPKQYIYRIVSNLHKN